MAWVSILRAVLKAAGAALLERLVAELKAAWRAWRARRAARRAGRRAADADHREALDEAQARVDAAGRERPDVRDVGELLRDDDRRI